MGFVGDLMGFGDNPGMNFRASGVPVLQGTDLGQVQGAYGNTQSGLAQQQAFINALQGQNALANQSNVYNQLQGVANGTGPNPALAQLQNTTGQNIAAQGALMAGQRGTGANAGLLARQVAQQGAGVQQNAIGQAAALQASQQLGALGQMGSLANTQAGQLQQGIYGLNQAAQSQQQNLLNALGQYNNSRIGMQGNINTANAGVAGETAKGQAGLFGGILGGAGAGLAMLAEGGMVKSGCYADGGPVSNDPTQPASFAGKFLKGFKEQQVEGMNNAFDTMGGGNSNPGAQALNQGANSAVSGAIQGIFGGSPIKSSQEAGYAPIAVGATGGSVVPGKAEVRGDNLKNDKVPAMLSPKEIVLPRSITLSENAPEMAKAFVAAILAKNGMKG